MSLALQYMLWLWVWPEIADFSGLRVQFHLQNGPQNVKKTKQNKKMEVWLPAAKKAKFVRQMLVQMEGGVVLKKYFIYLSLREAKEGRNRGREISV